MMHSRIYKLSSSGKYVFGIYHFKLFWILIFCLVLVLSYFVRFNLGILFFDSLILGLVLLELLKFIRRLKESKLKIFQAVLAEMLCRKALLATLSANPLKTQIRKIEIPGIYAVYSSSLKVCVQNLPGMPSVDTLTDVLSAGMRGALKKFAVSQAILTDDKTEIMFLFEKVGQNLSFCPKKLSDLIQKPYYLTLQKGLIVDLSKQPHLAVWGKSGTGKTTLLFSLIAQSFSSNTDVYFIDGKSEFTSFSSFYPKEKIASDLDNVLNMLDKIIKQLEKRQLRVASAVIQRQSLGLTAEDLNLQPIIIFADEVGSIVGAMAGKQKKSFISALTQIVQKGRSVGIFLILSSQSPATEVVPNSIREQFSTKILLGSAKSEIQVMAFGQKAYEGGVDAFQGFYLTDALTQPKKFFVPNLLKYHLEKVNTFKVLYELGKKANRFES